MNATASTKDIAAASLMLNVHKGYAKTVNRVFARRCWALMLKIEPRKLSLPDRHLLKAASGEIYEFRPMGRDRVSIRRLAA